MKDSFPRNSKTARLGTALGICLLVSSSSAAAAERSSLELLLSGDPVLEALCRLHCSEAHGACVLGVAQRLATAEEQNSRCNTQADDNYNSDKRSCESRYSQNPIEKKRCLQEAETTHQRARNSCTSAFDDAKKQADIDAKKCNDDEDACIRDCRTQTTNPNPRTGVSAVESTLIGRDILNARLRELESE